MSRRIVSTSLQAAGGQGSSDTYFDRVVKYVPADIVAAWLFIAGFTDPTSDEVILWVSFVALLVITPAWVWKQTQSPKLPTALVQIALSTVAFGVWSFALGGPFSTFGWYSGEIASVTLVLFTLVAGLVVPSDAPS